jgi:ATP-dependent helicase HrpA
VPTYAWPGLYADEKGAVSLRLFRTLDLAKESSLVGIQRLVELELSKDFAWLHRDLRQLNRYDALVANLCSLEELQETAYQNLRRHLLPNEVFWPLTAGKFREAVQQTRLRLPGSAQQLIDQAGNILRLRQEIQKRCGPAPVLPATKPKTLSSLSQLNLATKDAPRPQNIWAEELESLLPRNFLAAIPFAQLAQIPRYLKALSTRMDRAKLNPVKDKERAQQLAPYVETLKQLQATPPKSVESRKRLEEFRWMVEEFKVSLFAQELGTAIPVSPKRLDECRQKI